MHTFAWPFHLALCVFAVSGVKLLSPSQLSQPTTVIYNDTPEQNHTPDYTVNDGSTDIPNYNDFTGTTIFDEIYVNKDTHGYDEKFGYNNTFDYSSTPDYNNKQDYSNPPDYSPKTPDYNSTSDYSTTSDHSTTSDYSTTSGHSTTLDYSRTSDYSSTPIFSSTYYYYFYDYNYTFYDYNYDDGFVLDVLKPILLDALEVCPSLNFCAIKQNSSFEEDRSARRDKYQKETNITFESLSSNNTSLTSRCCEDCSCLTTCLAVQNCCPDAPVFSRDFISFQANCLSAFYISRVSHSGRLPNIDYKTISWCKSSKKNFFGWRGSSTASFEEVVRVSVENRLYYNKETATCNGEAKLTRWELIAFDCVDDLYSLTLQGPKLEKYVLENCTVYSDPPDHINPTQFICSPYDTISHCNATGLWNKFDWDIEALCLSAGGMF
ncbi:uncharacterized protein LOC123532320 [Mercenaria mercenaria]|uniref:uncharacterized protein LOC123532320 n=1 Tax=Mercenaria mercenaria TaxID=6596 RepID=UPI00234ED600|nr:uncharacterized protein LOC123532320 [Mercenaria mercenaria]